MWLKSRAQGPPPVAPANLAVELVLAAGGVPFCDETGVLKMRKPLPEGAQRFRQGFPILSRPMSAWLARMVYEAKSKVVFKSRTRRICAEPDWRADCFLNNWGASSTLCALLVMRPQWVGSRDDSGNQSAAIIGVFVCALMACADGQPFHQRDWPARSCLRDRPGMTLLEGCGNGRS